MQKSAPRSFGRTAYESALDQDYFTKWESPANRVAGPSTYRPAKECLYSPSCRNKLNFSVDQYDTFIGSAEFSRLRSRFNDLARRWQRESRTLSSPEQIFANAAYRQIIGLGEGILPHILDELQKSGNLDWVQALSEISGFQFLNRQRGPETLIETWLVWGREQGFAG